MYKWYVTMRTTTENGVRNKTTKITASDKHAAIQKASKKLNSTFLINIERIKGF